MGFEEPKGRQGVIWAPGPYERLPEHHAGALAHVVHAVESQPGEQALDVATGIGAVAVRLRRRSRVTGVDLAPALVETARRLAAEDGFRVR